MGHFVGKWGYCSPDCKGIGKAGAHPPSLRYSFATKMFIRVDSLVTISVDCVMSEWSEWSRKCCPIRGFGAYITRTRSVVTPASNGGKECGKTKEERFINPLACDDCKSSCTDKLGKWRCKQMEHKCMDEKHKPSIMKNCGETCCKEFAQKHPQNRLDCYSCRNKAGREFTA